MRPRRTGRKNMNKTNARNNRKTRKTRRRKMRRGGDCSADADSVFKRVMDNPHPR